MAYPDGYQTISAHKSSIDEAREIKEDLGLTWNEFLKQGAAELSGSSD